MQIRLPMLHEGIMTNGLTDPSWPSAFYGQRSYLVSKVLCFFRLELLAFVNSAMRPSDIKYALDYIQHNMSDVANRPDDGLEYYGALTSQDDGIPHTAICFVT